MALWLALALPSAAEADEAASLYDPSAVFVIHLTLPQSSEEALEADPEGEYQPGTFSISATDGTPDGEGAASAPVDVEVRLKGDTSFQTLAGKAAFKLKLPKDEDGKRPYGLKKMTLNNMVQDPSMVHETLAYEAFRAAGVPAPRTSYAYVYVNGRDYGLHLNVETLDDQAMERMLGTKFDDPQHLYEGESGHDVEPGEAASFEPDEGDEDDISDLEALIDAVASTGPEPWSQRVEPFADLAEMTRMWAVEKYVGQWDGYGGQPGTFQPNNYYLYSDALGRFQMLPWGQDETFQSSHHLDFGEPAGVLLGKCLEDEACFETYRQSLEAVLAAARGLDLPGRAEELDALLAPWQEEEADSHGDDQLRAEAHATAEEAADFASARPAEAEAWLAAHAPLLEEEGGEEVGDTASAGRPGGSAGAAVPGSGALSGSGEPSKGDESSTALASLGRIRVAGNAIRTVISVPEGGAVVAQRATYRAGKHRRTACAVPAKHRSAGKLVLRCHLRPAARHLRRSGELRLRVVTTVQASTGKTTIFRRPVTAADL